jgi:polyhydroxybutyrate depolymerase
MWSSPAWRILAFVFCLAGLLCAGAVSAQDRGEIVKVNGFERSMVVHLPHGYDKAKRYPVVLVLHEVGGNAATIANITHFDEVADQNSFIAVYPNAKDGHWTESEIQDVRQFGGFGRRRGGFGDMDAPRDMVVGGKPVADIFYFNQLLDQMESEYSVDTNRIYATGLSEGGSMDFKLGCELAERIAAIAPVAATFPVEMSDSCSNWAFRAVPVLMITGTEDPFVAYNGRLSYGRGYFLLSAKDSVKAWAKIDGCGQKPRMTTITPKTGAGLEAKVETYADCNESSEAVLYSIVKGGHTWPGGVQYMPERVIGKTDADLDATAVIWRFFSEHKMPPQKRN